MRFNGPDYDPKHDRKRLTLQHRRILDLMIDGRWRTLSEIERRTKDPASSISAQLRHLRKPRFGSYIVDKRKRGDRAKGLFEYQVREPTTYVKKLVVSARNASYGSKGCTCTNPKRTCPLCEARAEIARLRAEIRGLERELNR